MHWSWFWGWITIFVGNDATARATWVLVCVVLLQLLWMIRQERILKSSIDVAKQSADAAMLQAKAAIGVELPIIHAYPPNLLSVKKPIIPEEGGVGGSSIGNNLTRYTGIIDMVFRNLGRTQAALNFLELGWLVASKLPSVPRYYENVPLSHEAIIHSNDEYRIYIMKTIELDDKEIHAITTKSSFLWFFGRISYQDFLGATRISRFCWRMAQPSMGIMSFDTDGEPPKSYTEQN